ncbi:hypothetical protein BAC7755_30330 [Bacillus sp. MN7755]|uniref:Zn-dependent hydroxyacylglutathione hydrolase / Polysulfide binding protein n=1 Tax=Bacillus cereus TaxID=1396 RepID=A0A164BRW6_BACCE|nr:Zn-dependent hydroxyacylglutathione hydrolase / Polysulfide binding protein [Bacillus cereus]
MEVIAAAETHIHTDFLSGSREFSNLYHANLYVSDEGDCDWKYQYLNECRYKLVREGTEFKIGHIKFNAIHTPGHTPESISFLVTDTSQNNYTNDKPIGIFTGDFIFVGDIGRPDLLETAVGMKDTAKIGEIDDLFYRPKFIQNYADEQIDIVLSGHAHGVQFRLLFISKLVAPNQGVLPKYTAGLYEKQSTSMVVSRGLGNSIIPQRIFNRPELVVVQLN